MSHPGPEYAHMGAATPYYQQHHPTRPPADLTLTAILAFFSATIMTITCVVDALVVGDAIDSYPDTTAPSFLILAASSVLYLGALAAAYVTTCLWLWRARRNAELIEPTMSHSRRSGWIWGGWVVPVVNFWFPFQVVRDIYRASTGGLGTSSLLGWWWAGWVLFLIFSRIADSRVNDAINGRSASGAVGTSFVLAVLAVVGLVLWGLVIRKIVVLQHRALGLGSQ